MSYRDLIAQEREAFDKQIEERLAHGFVPDLRNLQNVDWFYNNVWRDPEFAKIQWMPRINHIIDRVKIRGGRVLEVGCGCGILGLEMARNGLHVEGVDISEKCIEIANKFKTENQGDKDFGSLKYYCADILDLDLQDETFDSVVFFRSLHHFPDLQGTLAKVHQASKEGAYLLISEPVRANFTEQSAEFCAVLRTILPTWEPYEKKLSTSWTTSKWQEQVKEVFREYTLDEHHSQSPLDNSNDDANEVISEIHKLWEIEEKSFSDAFVDKMIGGLRGEHRYDFARLLKFLDNYMIEKGILPPTSLELLAIKR
jgi:2-polyprenyl-3-methyl-5-hydroxy-6-metoxy-1,4-benzoquinol methylase